MAEAADQAHAVKLSGAFFKTADEQHVVIEFFGRFRVAFGSFRHGFGAPVFLVLTKLKRVVTSPKAVVQNIVILLRCTFRTVFGNPEMLLLAAGIGATGRDEAPPGWRT
jgi:hypothetical protein